MKLNFSSFPPSSPLNRQLLVLQDTESQHPKVAYGAIKYRSQFSSCRRRERSRFSTINGGRTPEKFAAGTRRTKSRRRTLWVLKISVGCLWFCFVDWRLLFWWLSWNSVGIPRRTLRPIDNLCARRWVSKTYGRTNIDKIR